MTDEAKNIPVWLTQKEHSDHVNSLGTTGPLGEVRAYRETTWKIECPSCLDEFVAPDDDCVPGASFTAECTSCGHKFPARAV